MEPSDLTLLRQYAQRQDAEAFSLIVRRHAGVVYGTCLRVAGNAHDAEDAAQECFLDLARHAGNVTTSLPGWLHTAATSHALMVLRKNSTRAKHEERASAMPRNDEPGWNELAPLVDEALNQLPEEDRLPLVLHFLQGKNQEQVAVELGISQPTASRRIAKGVSLLRDQLKKSGVVASVAVVGTLMAQNAASAAPVTLYAAMGKLALSGIGAAGKGALAASAGAGSGAGVSAAAASTGGGIAMKVAISAVVAAALITGGVVVHNVIAQKELPAVTAPAAAPVTHSKPAAATVAAPVVYDYAEALALYPAELREHLRVPTREEIAQMGVLWPSIPPQENAAYYYILATSLLPPKEDAPPGSASAQNKPYAGAAWAMEQWVGQNQRALETARKGLALKVNRPPCFIAVNMPSDPSSDTPWPGSIAGLREFSRRILDAGFLEEIKDNSAGAVDRYAECLRVGKSFLTGTLIDSLSAIAVEGTAQRRLDDLLTKQQPSETILRQVIAACRAAETAQGDPARAWEIECAFMTATMTMRKDLPKGSPLAVAMASFNQAVKDVITDKPLDALLQKSARDALLQKALNGELVPLRDYYGRWYVEMGRLNVRLRATQLRAAINLYRQAHGGVLPATLDALVPDILPAVPTDPFSGKPMRYELAEKGWKLWSVGEDNVDDGARMNRDIYDVNDGGMTMGADGVLRPTTSDMRGADYVFVMPPPSSPGATGERDARPAPKSPEELARVFVTALSTGDVETAWRLYPTREEVLKTFAAPEARQMYDSHFPALEQGLEAVAKQLRGAAFVRWNPKYSGEPTTLEPGKMFGPVKLAVSVQMLDNTHVIVRLGEQERDLKLDEMIRIDGAWRLLGELVLASAGDAGGI